MSRRRRLVPPPPVPLPPLAKPLHQHLCPQCRRVRDCWALICHGPERKPTEAPCRECLAIRSVTNQIPPGMPFELSAVTPGAWAFHKTMGDTLLYDFEALVDPSSDRAWTLTCVACRAGLAMRPADWRVLRQAFGDAKVLVFHAMRCVAKYGERAPHIWGPGLPAAASPGPLPPPGAPLRFVADHRTVDNVTQAFAKLGESAKGASKASKVTFGAGFLEKHPIVSRPLSPPVPEPHIEAPVVPGRRAFEELP